MRNTWDFSFVLELSSTYVDLATWRLEEYYYSKANLCQILLFGEKPHLVDKYTHNKFLAFAVQAFISKTKRLIASINPDLYPMLLHPMSQTDVYFFYFFDVFFCLLAFTFPPLLCILVLLSASKT